MDKMQLGEIRKLPKSSSPMFTEQYAVQGAARVPYIVSWKKINHPTQTEWQCSCKSWTTTVPRQDCKHVVAVKLKEGILVNVTPPNWGDAKPEKKYPLIMVKPEKGHVVISEEEHEAYKKFLEARGTRKAGNNFDEEGRRFRP
jgi:hypothetical protein